MSKTLYEEALADARKLKEVAENNAKRAVEEAVLPKIRDLIERKLFEDLDSEEEEMWGLDNDDDQLATSAIAPQDDNKVVLDLDKLAACCEPCEPCKSNEEVPSMDNTSSEDDTYVDLGMDKLSESMDKIKKDVVMYKTTSKVIRESKEFSNKIEELIERIQDTYSYVQECVGDSLKRKNIENILEGYYTEMSNFKEKIVMKNVKNLVNEGDLTIKLTGVPDDLDVDDLGIDLITGDDDTDFDMDDEEEMDSSDSESDEMPSEDSSESDDESDTSDEMPVEESADSDEDDMKDDDVVEISETMLKREIARMRNQRTVKENSMPVDNFGSGDAEGDPWLDAELNASDEAVNEGDEEVSSEEEAPPSSDEELNLKNKLNKETCTYTESLSRYFYLISEANKNKDKKKKSMLLDKAKKEAAKANEAKKKAADTKKNLKKLHLENHENRDSVSVTESRDQIESLRNKLNESNLFNAKLLATNKLLQNESLSSKQKISAIERLDEAKNVREVKLVYESIAKSIATKNSVNEHRVIGSSSRATKTSTSLNESAEEGESSRWARLAGIK